MPLVLRHMKGLNGLVPGSVQAIPNSRGPFTIAQICGGAIILGSENNLAQQHVLRGHDDAITAFAMSNGGALMATGQRGERSDVVIWDLATLAPKSRFPEHDVEVASLAFSLDDRLLMSASCNKDAKLVVLDTATGKIVSRHPLEIGKRVTAAAWAPSPPGGRTYSFATAAGEDITLWSMDPYSGQLSGQKVTLGSVRREYTCLLFSADGAWLYCGTTSSDVVTVNVQRRAVQMAHPVCSGGVAALLLSPDGSGATVAAGRDGSLSSFNVAAGAWRELRPFASVPGAAISSLGLTADRAAFLIGSEQSAVYRLDRSSLQLHTLSQAQGGCLTGLSFAPGQSEAVAAASNDGSVAVWNTQDYTLQCRAQEPAQARGALCCVLTRDTILSGWGDGHIRCHARAGGGSPCAPLWIIPGAHSLSHSVGVTAMKMSYGGSFLVTGGVGGEMRCWDLRSREMAAHMKLHGQKLVDVGVMADDKHVVAASEDRSWSLWEVGGEKARVTWRSPSMLRGLAVSPDKVSVVTITLDRKVMMWDVRGPEARWTKVEAHGVEGSCVASDNRGVVFATGGADSAVKVFDWRSGNEVAAGSAHSAPVIKLAFSPDDRGIVSVAADGTLAFWQLA
ncbi:hypothetical protein PLESTB_000121000 [Pleodorina starrii]|uniref:Uncharacterized protein n=1 Tax=Pleodorina starrii TaxID=330485 RepID=A0A9W6EXV6_9CHLO|nr:hypothetical protein PLESTB_000121000 [Pleodorina starrii]GLC76347.1 hypothetical protein PLESTF_001769800 [Pleodorina starrii]